MNSLLADRYELGPALGQGGMAEVWRARDRVLGRDVAVKTVNLAATTDPTTGDRLRREAVATAALEHPDIVTVYDAGVDGDTGYLVMELLTGRDLAVILREGPLQLGLALHVAARIAGALDAAHGAGIVHRDIKPANIVVDGADVTVLDFGIAAVEHHAVGTLTVPGTTFGTAEYMSPEQARGEPVSSASDMYSFGCLLTTLVAGRAPFTGEPPIVLLQHHAFRDAPRLDDLSPGVPRELVDLVDELLAKDPHTRPSARAARDVLDRLVEETGGEPVVAAVPDPGLAGRVGAAIAAAEANGSMGSAGSADPPATAEHVVAGEPATTAAMASAEPDAAPGAATRAGSGSMATLLGSTAALGAMPSDGPAALPDPPAGTSSPETALLASLTAPSPVAVTRSADDGAAGEADRGRPRRALWASMAAVVAVLLVGAAAVTLDPLVGTPLKATLVEVEKPSPVAPEPTPAPEPVDPDGEQVLTDDAGAGVPAGTTGTSEVGPAEVAPPPPGPESPGATGNGQGGGNHGGQGPDGDPPGNSGHGQQQGNGGGRGNG
ncbi:serine/threonine-protein kinase [Georgenia subflava]|uniref:serine/threonine-protein kinase n=1 Tax=Georgenia subflava TaxID=1622177 RepID=UPI00186ABC2F|nr:serine/threonine-protein kinase [Georgenia subflava]